MLVTKPFWLALTLEKNKKNRHILNDLLCSTDKKCGISGGANGGDDSRVTHLEYLPFTVTHGIQLKTK